ncbi:hypothetical protein CUMW_274140 [Citrus unshiu]|uniref:C-JID domain-containing protein n=1 Tax=Citrus unshiu TaxID=55188 RepID=A0A2H5MYS5_CITUN|nr:hypothetical protein CUMW_274140 [Citrus unshiu]
MEHLKRIYLGHTAITELPSSFENLPGLEVLFVDDCSKLDKLPDNIGNFESLYHISAAGSAIQSLALTGCNMLRSIPELPLCLKYLYLGDCNMLRSLPELSLCLQSLNARNCNRLQSLPEILSCLQELDAPILEKLSKPSPGLIQWAPGCLESQPIYFGFTNCLKLNGKANNKILADSLLIIRHMAIASLRLGYEKAINEKISELRGSLIVLPGSEIPDWFSHQNSGSSICIQLPQHSFCRNLIGFAFCAVPHLKQDYSDCFRYFYVKCQFELEINTLSETKHVDLGYNSHFIEDLIDSDNVILGFKPCLNVGFPDGYHHTTATFKFFAEPNLKGYKIKRCGVCPVYANPSETKDNTFTINFATEVWKLDDLPSASGTSDVEELEPSPKRICRANQINTP